MKTILTFAAVAAALTNASLASAHDTAGGHWEWRSHPSSGPKSTVPSRLRAWVKDGEASMASCDCAMMKADASGCMMDMRGKSAASSAG
jgi:phosphopentomutase